MITDEDMKYEQALLEDYLELAREKHAHVISPYNNAWQILKGKVIYSFNKAVRSKSEFWTNELMMWSGAEDELDYSPLDAGNPPLYDVGEWEGEAVTSVDYD